MSGREFSKATEQAASIVLTPLERLKLSRARMRVFLDRRKSSAQNTEGAEDALDIGAKVSAWTDGLRANPLTGAVVDAVHNWWGSHPLRSVTMVAGDLVDDLAVPWIRRNPLAVVGGALAMGVVASKLKPWRWIGKPALFAGLSSQIAAQLLTHAPLEFLVDKFIKFVKSKDSEHAQRFDTQETAADDDLGFLPPLAKSSERVTSLDPTATI